MNADSVEIVRVSEGVHWHALEDDLVAGRGHALRRPDGRAFLSIDAWQDSVFQQLAERMVSDLPAPVYTVVDEADVELLDRWQRAGFVRHRRELEYVLPTTAGPDLGQGSLPPDVRILPLGTAAEGPLRELDRAVRAEVAATIGWQSMPAEVLPQPDGTGVLDPSRYAVAALGDQYVGLIRVAALPRRPRLGLMVVRAEQRRRGIGRALLAGVLASLHRSGFDEASAEVDQANGPAIALLDSIGARRAGSAVELLHS